MSFVPPDPDPGPESPILYPLTRALFGSESRICITRCITRLISITQFSRLVDGFALLARTGDGPRNPHVRHSSE